jgi:hypothetical protein
MVRMVLRHPGRLRETKKRYRFTPPLSKRRMPVALSVDALCGFGAKNLLAVLISHSTALGKI